jgi:integrase
MTELTYAQIWPLYAASERDKLRSWSTVEGRARHVLGFWGAFQPSGACPGLVDGYRGWRAAQTTIRGKAPKPATVNREIELLRRIGTWAQKRGHATNGLAGVARADLFAPERNVRRTVVREGTLRALLDEADSLMRAFLLVAIDSGMRREEIVTLTWEQVRWESGLVEVWWSKTDEQRVTLLSDRAIRALEALPRAKGCPWVFANLRTKRHYHADAIYAKFRRLCAQAEATGPDGRIWIHDLRRSFNQLFVERGGDTVEAMRLMGHKTLASQQRYRITSLRLFEASRKLMERGRREDLRAITRGPRRGPQKSASAETPSLKRESL